MGSAASGRIADVTQHEPPQTTQRDVTSIPDEPIRHDSEDDLERGEFADAMVKFITAADADASLRMGIYGGWGEGKTSVLELMQYRLRLAGHVCVFLTSWASQSRQELLRRLLREIARELDIQVWAAVRQWAKPLQRVMKTARSTVKLDPRIKAADAVLGDAVEGVFGAALDKAADQQTQIVLQAISHKLADRKLIVFIDDLDRVRPELVPELLLTLREALNQPKYFYVMALAPEVVEQGLAAVHHKWGEPATFLEKIIEFPRYLPAISGEQRDAFVRKQLAKLTHPPDEQILLSLRELLPKNPRKLKILIRMLAAVGADRARYDPDEVQWDVFYLVQLLRVEFPVEATQIIEDAAALKDFEHGFFLERIGEQRNEPMDVTSKAYGKYLPAKGARRDRFIELCEGLRARPRWHGRYSLRELFLLPDEPPSFTRKEAQVLLQRFANASEADEKALIEEAVRSELRPSQRRMKALFLVLLELRELHVGAAVDEPTDAAVKNALEFVAAITRMLEILVREYGIFRQGIAAFHEWEKLLAHVERWAHFVGEPYTETRKGELDLLTTVMNTARDETKVAILNRWDPVGFFSERQQLRQHLDDLLARERHTLAEQFLDRLSLDDALSGLYGDEMRSVRDVVFDGTSVLYTNQQLRGRFLTLANSAGDSLAIQTNFAKLLAMADYGAFGSAVSFDRDGCRRLLSDVELVGAIWAAATAHPLQRRQAGSLLGYRKHLVGAGMPEEKLAIPKWLRAFLVAEPHES